MRAAVIIRTMGRANMPCSPNKLTFKQRRFVEEYLVDRNATQAYRRAGYTVKNDNVAAVRGNALVRNSKIWCAIRQAEDARSHRIEINQDFVLQRLAIEGTLPDEAGGTTQGRTKALELLGKHLA